MKPPFFIVVVAVAALVVGFLLGRFSSALVTTAAVLVQPAAPTSVAAPATPAAQPAEESGAPIERFVQAAQIKDLREEIQRLRGRLENDERRQQGQQLAPAGALKLEQISLNGYANNGASLHPELIRFFDLSTEQAAAIDAQVKERHQETTRCFLESARLTEKTADRVVVKCDAFPEKAAMLEERLNQTVRSVASAELSEQLLYFLTGSRNRQLSSGFSDYEVTFSKTRDESGKMMYGVMQSGNGGSSTSRSTDLSVFRPNSEYGPLLKFLPPGFLPEAVTQ